MMKEHAIPPEQRGDDELRQSPAPSRGPPRRRMDGQAKLEQFMLLSKGARGRAIAELILSCTAEPGIYAFGELLDVPNVKELQGTEFSTAYDLLQMFAFGTWSTYRGNVSKYPALNEQHKHKLKQLTVVSMAESRKTLPYTDLMSELEASNIRELEDLLISDCFYSGLIKGKLDQKGQRLHVHETIARDVRPQQLQDVMGMLSDWVTRAQCLAAELEERSRWAISSAEAAEASRADTEARIDDAKKALKSGADVGTSTDATYLEDQPAPMDYMDEDRSGTAGRPKRRR